MVYAWILVEMIHGKAILDQGRKAITITSNNVWMGTWSGVTRKTSVAKIAQDGWSLAPNAEWKISPFDNGHVVDVIKGN